MKTYLKIFLGLGAVVFMSGCASQSADTSGSVSESLSERQAEVTPASPQKIYRTLKSAGLNEDGLNGRGWAKSRYGENYLAILQHTYLHPSQSPDPMVQLQRVISDNNAPMEVEVSLLLEGKTSSRIDGIDLVLELHDASNPYCAKAQSLFYKCVEKILPGTIAQEAIEAARNGQAWSLQGWTISHENGEYRGARYTTLRYRRSNN